MSRHTALKKQKTGSHSQMAAGFDLGGIKVDQDSFNCSFLPDLIHSPRMILQYAPVESCMDAARLSSSLAISIFMLMPMVFVPFPAGLVAIVYLPSFNESLRLVFDISNKSFN